MLPSQPTRRFDGLNSCSIANTRDKIAIQHPTSVFTTKYLLEEIITIGSLPVQNISASARPVCALCFDRS